MNSKSALPLAGAAAIAALAVGGLFNPGPQHPRTALWYARLDKPSVTPPGPVFGAAWPILDSLLAFTGYRLLKAPSSPVRTASLASWALTLLCIPGYSWTFFGRRRAGEGLAASGSMLVSALALTATSSRIDRNASLATIPLIAWLTFATFLQEEVWRRN